MARLPPLEREQMNEDQARVAAEIFATRGISGGPFAVWLRSPELADRAQKFGAFTRYHTSLEKRLSELVILITARLWTAQFEWAVHEEEARRAGLDDELIRDIREGRRPKLRPDEAVIHDFIHELYATRAMSQPTYERARAQFGETGVVELVAIIGYYAFISMTLNVFDCDTPDGSRPLAPLPL